MCPEECTFGWTIDKLVKNFKLNKNDLEKMKVEDMLDITEDLLLQRDE